MAELLKLEGVTAGYGESVIVEDVSFSLAAGETLAVLGRNGVGKTTLLRTVLGLTSLQRGTIHFRGRDLARTPVYARANAGLGWVPQERGIFPSLSVEEHLTAVARPGPLNLRRVYELFPRLAERRLNLGHRLSGGEQQMLAMGRALMLNPELLLLDEPMEGLAPILVQGLCRTIEELATQSGMAIVLVEQHARKALALTRRVVVLERGRISHSSASDVLLGDPELLARLVAVA
jgi:branched-chain amino acid transport system ATP-binding protein